MKKILSLALCVTTLIGVMAVPASACGLDPDGNVHPCYMVEEKGYCDWKILRYGITDPYTGVYTENQIVNPYYDEEKVLQAAQEAAEPEKKAESESTENPGVNSYVHPVEEEPELPLADVAVPVTISEGKPWEATDYDFIRISHAVAQETVMYEGKPMELYSIYPNARVWKTKTATYSPMKIYHATLENGTLTAGELSFEFEVEEPTTHCGYLYWEEEDVGSYYIAEIGDPYFNKKIGIHVVEGTLPENVPTYYVYDVGLSQTATYNKGDIFTVPVGTVVTLPYNTAGGRSLLCGANASSMDPFPSREAALNAIYGGGNGREECNYTYVEPYLSNGRKSFTVEPGKMYHINYWQGNILNIEGICEVGFNEAHIFVVAEGTALPASVATPSTQTVNVDGKDVEFAMYALDGGSTNYIRVRDLAAVLNGTAAQFNVGWNGNVTLTSKTPYNGATDQAPFSTSMSYTDYTAPTYVDGEAVDLEAIQIEYDGGGFTYYKLRDLAQALNFNVSWSLLGGISVETDKPYDSSN